MQDGVVHVFANKDGKSPSIKILMLLFPLLIIVDLVAFFCFSNN